MEVLEKAYVNSPYGNRNGKMHNGVDLLSGSGNRTVFANNKAKVLEAVDRMEDTFKVNEGEYSNYAGNYIVLEHGNGYTSQYSHLKHGSFKVKVGDIVEEGQALAEEGSSGYSFGVHLDYMVKKDEKYVDPTNYGLGKELLPTYEEKTQEDNFLGSKGYFSLGDTHENVGKIAEFMYRVFPAYTDKRALGNYYGPYIQESIKEFQKRTHAEGKYNAEIDGNVGPITLDLLKQYGFHE